MVSASFIQTSLKVYILDNTVIQSDTITHLRYSSPGRAIKVPGAGVRGLTADMAPSL